MPTLTIQLPGLPPVDHILREEMMTIGRMKGNTIALDDVSVSVSHAKITRKGAEFFLKDLNSTNGTMLNGQSINEARLKDGDQLKFGEVIAIYRSEPDFVSTAPGQNPPAAPVAQSASTSPPPAPSSVGATSLVPRRLVTQAQPTSPAPSAASHAAQTSHSARPRKKQPNWLIPMLGGGSALAVVVIIAAKVFTGNDAGPKTSPTAPEVLVSAKNPPNNNPAGATTKPITTPSTTIPAAAPLENKNVADLKKALKSADPAERRRAAAALHGLGAGAKEAVPELRVALNDSDQDVRMWSALALINNKSYDKAAIPILIKVLHHDNSMLRQVSCLSLALIPYEEADKEMVLNALADTANKDDDEEVRKAAMSALKIIAPEFVLPGK